MNAVWYALADPGGPDWLAAAVAGLFFVVLPLVTWSVWLLRWRQSRKRTANSAGCGWAAAAGGVLFFAVLLLAGRLRTELRVQLAAGPCRTKRMRERAARRARQQAPAIEYCRGGLR